MKAPTVPARVLFLLPALLWILPSAQPAATTAGAAAPTATTATGGSSPDAGKGDVLFITCADSSSAGDTTAVTQFDMRLSDAARIARPPEAPPPLAIGRELTAEELGRILARMPPFSAAPEETSFALPPASLPPPKAGRVIDDVFPPEAEDVPGPQLDREPLRVLRYAPEGELATVSHLAVTFSEPMVALASPEAALAENSPVELTPQPEGQWRWIDTRTLAFETQARWPMATEYRARIPAGVRAATGATLEAGLSWTFTTPVALVEDFWPQDGGHGLAPLLFARFNQRIDPQAVSACVRLESDRRSWPLRPATADEIAASPLVTGYLENAPGCCVVLRAVELLLKDTRFWVTFGPGVPSAEGPQRTADPQVYSFFTYAPLRVSRWPGPAPTPGVALGFRFNNSLGGSVDAAALVSVDPPIEGLQVWIEGSDLTLAGATRARTTYHIVLSAEIRDVFGQTLGQPFEDWIIISDPPVALHADLPDFALLDPAVPPAIVVYSIGCPALRVTMSAVSASDWPLYKERWVWERVNLGEPLYADTVKIPGEGLEPAETRISLAPALRGKPGQLLVRVEPLPQKAEDRDRNITTWLQSTRIGLSVHADADSAYVWATDLLTGAPLPGVAVRFFGGLSVRTDGSGLARLALPRATVDLLVATRGEEQVIFPRGHWRSRPLEDELIWYTVDDRRLYQPGETVHLKGWVRLMTRGPAGGVQPLGSGITGVEYKLHESLANVIAEGQAAVDEFGGFHFEFVLPQSANLGTAYVELQAIGASIYGLRRATFTHDILIQEFRRPEFEIAVRAEEGPFFIGKDAWVTAEGTLFSGGPLAQAEVGWSLTADPGHYQPPGWQGFTFVGWQPWWDTESGHRAEIDKVKASHQAFTDAEGRHCLKIDFAAGPPVPMSVIAEATIEDINRQAWSDKTVILVHPAEVYVGLRTKRYFTAKGEPLPVEVVVTDLDGNPVSGCETQFVAERREWRHVEGMWQPVVVKRFACSFRSREAPLVCKILPDEGGTWELSAIATDRQGRRSRTSLTRWVAGKRENHPQAEQVTQARVVFIPERDAWAPGDTARVLVQAPFIPAEALIRICREGTAEVHRARLVEPDYTIEVPIKKEHVPCLWLAVDLVGAEARQDADGVADPALPVRPAYAAGSIRLRVPPDESALSVTVNPGSEVLAPGESTRVCVTVRDAAGEPAGDVQVLLAVVDEAILALTGHRFPDPLPRFHPDRGAGISDAHLRRHVRLQRPEVLKGLQGATGTESRKFVVQAQSLSTCTVAEALTPMAIGDFLAGGRAIIPPSGVLGIAGHLRGGRTDATVLDLGAPPSILMRIDFSPLACFAAQMRTGANGEAWVTVTLPDNLTRYRLMAVAIDHGVRCGMGEALLRARLPLMVRPALPRFLNYGDRCELSVVVQNQTDDSLTTDVALRTGNLLLTGPAGRRIEIPPQERREVRFPAATRQAGGALAQVGACAGRFSDAAQVSFPVWTPATTEAFAVYGALDKGALAQPVRMPPDIFPEFGGLEVTTSSTELQALTDAVIYLKDYPYECAEQRASRILAIAALRDVLAAFEAGGLPDSATLLAKVTQDIYELALLQNQDGGFGMWRREEESLPFLTLHVAHALARAHEKGLGERGRTWDRVLRYIREIERHIPDSYGVNCRRSLIAYALYVRLRMEGSSASDRARLRQTALDLIAEAGGVERLPLEALGWLMPVLGDVAATDTGVDARSDSGKRAPAADEVRRRLKRVEPARGKATPSGPTDEETAKLAATRLSEIHRLLENRAAETAATAQFTTDYEGDEHLILHSSRRTDAILLEGLIATKPESDLILKLVRGLLAARVSGRWRNTQENVWALLALDLYFRTYEKERPDFIARVWLDGRFAGEQRYQGRTTERHRLDIAHRYLGGAGEPVDLILAKDGPGRLYYRLGMRYAPRDLTPPAVSRGFTVERTFRPVDDSTDVSRDEQGVWHIRAGARVRVRLTLVAPAQRYHVALQDHVPAGLEALNPELRMVGQIPADEEIRGDGKRPPCWSWWSHWFEHQNLRTDRVEAFRSTLQAGVYTYSYAARATTVGRFVAPPPRAEEMYFPETFGRGEGEVVVVEDR